jgi:hypothetical protein
MHNMLSVSLFWAFLLIMSCIQFVIPINFPNVDSLIFLMRSDGNLLGQHIADMAGDILSIETISISCTHAAGNNGMFLPEQNSAH